MTPDNEPRERHRRRRMRVAAPVIVIIGALAAGGFAWAQDTPTPQTTSPAPTGEPDGRRGAMPFGPGRAGHGDHGMMGNELHGEFTVQRNDGDGFLTVLVQRGEATAVSGDSITLKSADGYEKTYQVDDDTLVNSNRDGIESIKKGDEVRVVATVSDGEATAVRVVDASAQQEMRGRMGGLRGGPPGNPSALAG